MAGNKNIERKYIRKALSRQQAIEEGGLFYSLSRRDLKAVSRKVRRRVRFQNALNPFKLLSSLAEFAIRLLPSLLVTLLLWLCLARLIRGAWPGTLRETLEWFGADIKQTFEAIKGAKDFFKWKKA